MPHNVVPHRHRSGSSSSPVPSASARTNATCSASCDFAVMLALLGLVRWPVACAASSASIAAVGEVTARRGIISVGEPAAERDVCTRGGEGGGEERGRLGWVGVERVWRGVPV